MYIGILLKARNYIFESVGGGIRGKNIEPGFIFRRSQGKRIIVCNVFVTSFAGDPRHRHKHLGIRISGQEVNWPIRIKDIDVTCGDPFL
jgi:hypothetical protein